MRTTGAFLVLVRLAAAVVAVVLLTGVAAEPVLAAVLFWEGFLAGT